MDFKNRLVLFFILIAIIPIAALSIVFSITVIEFKGHMANAYTGFAQNAGILAENKGNLLAIRSELVRYTQSTDPEQKQSIILHAQELKDEVAKTISEYRRIEELPGSFSVPGSVDVSKLASDERLWTSRMDQQWEDYASKVDDLAILSTDQRFAAQAAASAQQLLVLTDSLVESHDALIELNGEIGAASREQSQRVIQLAFFYGGLASAISAACATAAAILVSRRVVLGDLVRMTKLDLVETTLRDLVGGGADAILEMIKNQMPAGHKTADVATAVVHSAGEEVMIGGRAKLGGRLVIVNTAGQNFVLDSLLEANPVVITRKGSNLYHGAKGRSTLCVLEQDPSLEKGERTVPSGDEGALAGAIEDLMNENPSSAIVLDSATELIYTLGFEKVFALLRRLSEMASTHGNGGVVVLINKKAHEPRVVEAIGEIANDLLD